MSKAGETREQKRYRTRVNKRAQPRIRLRLLPLVAPSACRFCEENASAMAVTPTTGVKEGFANAICAQCLEDIQHELVHGSVRRLTGDLVGAEWSTSAARSPHTRVIVGHWCSEHDTCDFCNDGEVIASIGQNRSDGFRFRLICERCIKDLQHEMLTSWLQFLHRSHTEVSMPA